MNALTPRATSLAPTNMAEAMQFARMLADSTMVPAAFQGKPGNCLVAIQWGAELGLGPLQALQNIAVINGRPTLWGDAALALVRGHPACVGVREGVQGEGDARHGWCEVTRRGVGWLSTAYPSWPWRLLPIVNTSPATVHSTVRCLPAATAATARLPRAETTWGAITAPSPL